VKFKNQKPIAVDVLVKAYPIWLTVPLKSLNCKFTIVPGPVPAKRTAVRPEGSIVDSPADVVVIEDVAVVNIVEVVSPPGVEAKGVKDEPEELEDEPEELEDEPEEVVVVEGDDGEVGPEPSQSARDG
jgi:hypothetical protein